jgi:hypothetical protein
VRIDKSRTQIAVPTRRTGQEIDDAILKITKQKEGSNRLSSIASRSFLEIEWGNKQKQVSKSFQKASLKNLFDGGFHQQPEMSEDLQSFSNSSQKSPDISPEASRLFSRSLQTFL